MNTPTVNNYQEDYQYSDLYGLYPPEDAFRNPRDIENEEFLRKFYKGEVKGQYMCEFCERYTDRLWSLEDQGACEHCFNDAIGRAENQYDVARDEGRI